MVLKSKLLFLPLFFLFPFLLHAQNTTTVQHPQNIKLLDEYKDGKGHLVRVIQYAQGSMRVTETIIMPLVTPANIRVAVNPDTLKKHLLSIVVVKSDYCVKLLYGKRIIRSYKAVFGPKPMLNKMMEGDRCTPEGSFKIASKNPNSKYDRFMGLNYPNDSCYKRFNDLKVNGKIPATAKIGGDVGIHGIWQGGDDLIEMGVGWTDGCIALKNRDIEELFSFVGVGTPVIVRK